MFVPPHLGVILAGPPPRQTTADPVPEWVYRRDVEPPPRPASPRSIRGIVERIRASFADRTRAAQISARRR